ncbi:MAG: mechanosensitive ion channel [Clostridia bacterium]|nr:mechanosensitive ion channel [Clostridia bacterium]
MPTLEQLLGNIVNWLSTEGVKVVIALVLLVISFAIVRMISKRLKAAFEKKGTDKTIAKVVVHVFDYGARILIVLCLLGYLGIETSGVAALISALGVGVGLAVQGALSNLAGGVLIILTRPFKVDDYIEAEGFGGTVEDINIIHTTLRTPDNKVIILPNGTLANSNVVNYSIKATRRVDFDVSIAYSADFDKAKRLIADAFEGHEKVLKDPAYMIRMKEHGASAIVLTARCHVNSVDYWDVFFDITEQIKASFDANGIEIPFNQLDVHVIENK